MCVRTEVCGHNESNDSFDIVKVVLKNNEECKG